MSLFDKISIGSLILKNRIVLSAMTRLRSDPKTGLANDLQKEYYQQRSGAGLILTQASCISQVGNSWPGSPNIMNKQQSNAWKPIVEAVKKNGSNIFLQAYHGGRNCHKLANGGLQTWAPSPIALRENFRSTQIPYDKPHQMTQSDIKKTIQEFHNAANLAKLAGFDGVQIHGASGYLVDSFIRSCSNKRTDKYGGSPQNRARFLLEIIDSMKNVFSTDRISVKLSPVMRYGDMNDDTPKQTYTKILQLLDKKIGSVEIFSEVGQQSLYGYPDPQKQFPNIIKQIRPYFSGILIGNNGFNPETAKKAIANGDCDLISFGRSYISNPDLAQRIERNQVLNSNIAFDKIYVGGASGYIDYPNA